MIPHVVESHSLIRALLEMCKVVSVLHKVRTVQYQTVQSGAVNHFSLPMPSSGNGAINPGKIAQKEIAQKPHQKTNNLMQKHTL